MSKLPWTKYVYSLWIVAIVAALTAKYVTDSLIVLLPLSIGLYLISVRTWAAVKGYE